MSVLKNGSSSTSTEAERNWWRQACVYQIYPRSFYDANGDGIGDLKGITEKVPYLAKLGVDAVWLSPFYPSALKDGGYDVADYRNVDPKIGTLEDFDEMMAAFKAKGIKVIVDIVPNHSSDEHVWFQEALKAPKGSNERERYIFRDGKGPDKSIPPTDWQSIFAGPAWEPVGDGQFYMHMFDTSQPDFNWEHPEVRADFLKTLRFWADRGVSGFRVDVAHGLAKDLDFPNLMDHKAQHALYVEKLQNGKANKIHPLWDRDDVHDIYREWRKVFDEYDPPLTAVAEAWVASDRKHLYASSEGLGQSFSFDMLMCDFKREQFKEKIDTSLADAKNTDSSTTWVFSNHDVVRHTTRYGLPKAVDTSGEFGLVQFCPEWLQSRGKTPHNDEELGLRRARAATLMMLALPGSAYLYQGEELGLQEVADIPHDDRQDPTYFRTNGGDVGRDGCRVPIPWTKDAKNFGFGSGAPAHMPQPEWFGKFAVDQFDDVPGSTLTMYRDALKLRKQLQAPESIEWVTDETDSLHFKRDGGWEIIMNFEGENVVVPENREVLLASGELDGKRIPKNTTVWLRPSA